MQILRGFSMGKPPK